MLKSEVVTYIDLETSGGSPMKDRIIEIGLVQYFNGKQIRKFETLLNPNCNVSSFITGITGIKNSDLVGAPEFSSIMNELFDWIEDTIIVAHNVNFDFGFLKAEFSRHGIKLKNRSVCSVRVSRALYPEYKKHSLDSLIERYGFECERRHRALDDAKVIYDFFDLAVKDKGLEEFEKVFFKQIETISLPVNISKDFIETVPESFGVYTFYGKDNAVLFVSKSLNLKSSILSHFKSSKSESKKFKLFQSVKKIEYVEVEGEISAMLLEKELIDRKNPAFNEMFSRETGLIVLRKRTFNGYFYPKKESFDEVQMNDMLDSIAVFRTERQLENFYRKIGKEFGLCHHYLFAKFKETPCTNYETGLCSGACVNSISADTYNKRFVDAFSYVGIKPWIVNGYMMVTETSDDNNGEILIFNKWCLVAKGKYDDTFFDVSEVKNPVLNLDVYKVLLGMISDNSGFEVVSENQFSEMMNLSF
jgi:DNA polymerase-3 subunit epsilon